jgi:hypothetical protein
VQRLLDASDLLIGSSTRTYRRNRDNYYQAHLGRALAVLALCEGQPEVDPRFFAGEIQQVQAQLMPHEKTLGGWVRDASLPGLQWKRSREASQQCAQNWELLRQRAEEEGLYFEPLEMPGGSATHALLWVDRADVSAARRRRFNGRFLNIASPWHDPKVADWEGFSEVRFFDSQKRPVSSETANARAAELIPLAVYGLDHPKIPALLVDFRKSLNPKGRELSRYAVDDVSRYLLSLSPFGNLNYLVARSAFQFVASKRGTDIHQPSRLRTYSQLKLLLSLNQDFDADFRDEISRRLERVSTNALENDLAAEVQLARQQYQALVAYAKRPDGLPARLAKDRQAEMSAFVHRGSTRVLLRLSNVFSLGLYRHREAIAPGDLSLQRQTAYHTGFLEPVLKSGRSTLLDGTGTAQKAQGPVGPLSGLLHDQLRSRRPSQPRLAEGTQLRPDGSLNWVSSFVRLNYFESLHALQVRNNVQKEVDSRPVDFTAVRVPREALVEALNSDSLPEQDAVWLYAGEERQVLVRFRHDSSGRLELRYMPVARLRQDEAGRITLQRCPAQPDLPLRLWEDPQLLLPQGHSRTWLEEWHTEQEWLQAIHRTRYSNALISLHEHFHSHTEEILRLDEPGLSTEECLLRRSLRFLQRI